MLKNSLSTAVVAGLAGLPVAYEAESDQPVGLYPNRPMPRPKSKNVIDMGLKKDVPVQAQLERIDEAANKRLRRMKRNRLAMQR